MNDMYITNGLSKKRKFLKRYQSLIEINFRKNSPCWSSFHFKLHEQKLYEMKLHASFVMHFAQKHTEKVLLLFQYYLYWEFISHYYWAYFMLLTKNVNKFNTRGAFSNFIWRYSVNINPVRTNRTCETFFESSIIIEIYLIFQKHETHDCLQSELLSIIVKAPLSNFNRPQFTS